MKRMHLICNAHIDPMWQWEWNEGAGAVLSTFRVAAELCEEYGAFVFNHNESLIYEWIEEYEPALFRKIQALAKNGNWHIMGGWYLQPDCNMPNGESFVRQISTGLRYFKEKFGSLPHTAINFDPFGHTKGLVQIMNQSGFDSYIICRPYNNIPPVDRFVWKGFAGSEVKVLRLPIYNTPLGKSDIRIRETMERQKEEDNGVILWGVGNHGGGPSKTDLENISKLIADTKDVEIVHATPEDFFASCNEESWPTYDKSLQRTMVGCYSSQIRMKQLHRKLEHELLSTEKMLSAATAQGLLEYPRKELEVAWKDLMFAQFHDILPGSSIQPVEEAGLRLLNHGLIETERLKTRAFFQLSSGQAKAAEGEIPILVYNPHPFEIETDIACDFMLADQYWDKGFVNILVFDEFGNRLPSQVEKESSNIPIEWRKRVAFRGTLSPSGMTRFNIRTEILPERPTAQPVEENDCYVFHGAGYTAKISKSTGLLESYVVSGKEYLQKPSGKILIIKDNEDSWGMTVQGFPQVCGTFRLATPEETAAICGLKIDALDGVHIIENGEVRTIAECVFTADQGQAVIRYCFSKNAPQIDIDIRLITTAKDTMFKYVLETALDDTELLGRTAFGLDALQQDGSECVAQDYVLLRNREYALSVANNGTYACSAENGELRLTLFRTSAYCAHPIENRQILRQDRFGERIDQGERLWPAV